MRLMDNTKTATVVAVRFQDLGKLYYFDSSIVPDLAVGDFILVVTSRGRELGGVAGRGACPPPGGAWGAAGGETAKSHANPASGRRRVGPRDVPKTRGGVGACGLQERCCSKFLTEFSPISIKMAKAQGISLNPQEITGMCGRLRCCLVYEYDQYVQARKELPKVKKRVVTPMGPGKVVDVLPLRQAVIVHLEEEDRRGGGRAHETQTPVARQA